jgi:hypothetical protein
MLVLLMARIVKYTIERTLGGMIDTRSSMTIGSGIQVILRLLPQQFERLLYYCDESNL